MLGVPALIASLVDMPLMAFPEIGVVIELDDMYELSAPIVFDIGNLDRSGGLYATLS